MSDDLQPQWALSDGKLDLVRGIRKHARRLAGTVAARPTDPEPAIV